MLTPQAPYLMRSASYADKEREIELHKQHQRMMKEHVVLYEAYHSGALMASPEVLQECQAIERRYQQEGVEGDTARMLAEMVMNISARPSEIFPSIAADVEQRVREMDVSWLQGVFNQNTNPDLSDLAYSQQEAVKGIVSQHHVQATLRYELLHEQVFQQGESADHPGRLENRLREWVKDGAKVKTQSQVGNALSLTAGAFGLVTGSPGAFASFLATKVGEKAYKRIRNMETGIAKAAVASVKSLRSAPAVERLDEWLNKKVGESPYQNQLNTLLKGGACLSVLALLVTAGHSAPEIGQHIALVTQNMERVADFFTFDLESRFFPSPVQETINTISLEGEPVEPIAQGYADAEENARSGIRGAVLGGVAFVTGLLKDRFAFKKEATPFKENPFDTLADSKWGDQQNSEATASGAIDSESFDDVEGLRQPAKTATKEDMSSTKTVSREHQAADPQVAIEKEVVETVSPSSSTPGR